MMQSELSAYRQILRALSLQASPMPMRDLAKICKADPATVKRRVNSLRKSFKAPIASGRKGYSWRPAPHESERAKALLEVFK